MKKLKVMVIVLLSAIATGCSKESIEHQADSSIQSEEQYSDNEVDSISYNEYSGYWSYEGKTHEQI